MINTIEEDYVAMAGGEGHPGPPRVTPTQGATPSCRPQRVCRAVRPAPSAASSHRVRLQLPGRGFTLQQAALGSDYPLTQGLLLVFAVCVIVANFVMDLLNVVLDPRVRSA